MAQFLASIYRCNNSFFFLLKVSAASLNRIIPMVL
jgi:hypothetical protein